MTDWPRVKWSEAGQIADLLGWKDAAAGAKTPAAYFAALTGQARYADAVKFLALALPRLETVAWAARTVRDTEPVPAPNTPQAAALKAALLWLQDPVEGRRRAAQDAAEAAGGGAEAMAAMAAFYSGGSIAPPDCEPLPAPRDAAGKFSAGAVLLAAARSPDEDAALRAALKHGEMLAIEGLTDGARG